MNQLDMLSVVMLNVVAPHKTCGLYYEPMRIVNDDSKVINKLEASLTDDARVVIYDRYMFIAKATATVCTISPTKKTCDDRK
jgi:hypothetical protein